jgi:hypothetical protein
VARAEAAQQLAKLQRELDHRDEAIRKLEQQLKGAYQGLNRAALRASSTSSAADGAAGVRVSRVGGAVGRGGAAVLQSSEEVLQGLRPGENMIEITVADATLMVGAVLLQTGLKVCSAGCALRSVHCASVTGFLAGLLIPATFTICTHQGTFSVCIN